MFDKDVIEIGSFLLNFIVAPAIFGCLLFITWKYGLGEALDFEITILEMISIYYFITILKVVIRQDEDK